MNQANLDDRKYHTGEEEEEEPEEEEQQQQVVCETTYSV